MAIAPMSTSEALALARLRQWCYDRLQLNGARTVDYQRHGWQQRNSATFDARLVRVIDFERAMSTLNADEQAALILTHRDRERAHRVAIALRCSERKLSYLLQNARRKLAHTLDRLDLL